MSTTTKTITLSPETVGVLMTAVYVRISTIRDILQGINERPKFDSEDEILRDYWADEMGKAQLAADELRAQLELAA